MALQGEVVPLMGDLNTKGSLTIIFLAALVDRTRDHYTISTRQKTIKLRSIWEKMRHKIHPATIVSFYYEHVFEASPAKGSSVYAT